MLVEGQKAVPLRAWTYARLRNLTAPNSSAVKMLSELNKI